MLYNPSIRPWCRGVGLYQRYTVHLPTPCSLVRSALLLFSSRCAIPFLLSGSPSSPSSSPRSSSPFPSVAPHRKSSGFCAFDHYTVAQPTPAIFSAKEMKLSVRTWVRCQYFQLVTELAKNHRRDAGTGNLKGKRSYDSGELVLYERLIRFVRRFITTEEPDDL